MLLYEDKYAPNPRRVRIFLAEKGIEVERRHVEIMKQEHKTPEMLRRNPFERLPFLELDDGTVIAETVAICRYFDAIQPEPTLFGDSARERGLVEMWQRRVEFYLLELVSHAFRHAHPRMAPLEQPQIKQWSEVNAERAVKMLDFLNGELAGRGFVAGENFSIADITALCTVDFMKVARLQLEDRHEHLKRWHDAVSARPSGRA